MEANLILRGVLQGAGLTGARSGKAPSDRPALEPYRGKPAVRHLREDGGNVGIMRSPLRASVLPDPRGAATAPTGGKGRTNGRIC